MQRHMKHKTFSVLDFNVFSGSPHSFVPCSKAVASLGSSCRLPAQLKAINKLNPDIVCLQELTCDFCSEYYRSELSLSGYNACSGETPCTIYGGAGHIGLVLVLAGLFYSFAKMLHLIAVSVVVNCSIFAAWFDVCALMISIVAAWYQCRVAAMASWMSGTTTGGVMIFFKKAKFELLQHSAQLFHQQTGDWLNYFRPRGFNYVMLQSTTSNEKLRITNAHCNLGDDCYRAEQVQEVLKSSQGDSTPHIICGDYNATAGYGSIRLFKEASFSDAWEQRSIPDSAGNTWCECNTMTHAIFQVPDERVDFIFHRAVECSSASLVFDEPPYLSDHFGVLAVFVMPQAMHGGA